MAYTLTNLQDDIRSYTEVDSGVLSNSIINTMIKNTENRILRERERLAAQLELQLETQHDLAPVPASAINLHSQRREEKEKNNIHQCGKLFLKVTHASTRVQQEYQRWLPL